MTILTTVSRLTVLLLILTGSGVIHAWEVNKTHLHVFEFTSDFVTHLGPCHLKGKMATDGARHRIAVCWTEPTRLRDEDTFFISCCDILLTGEAGHYWIPGMTEPGVLPRSDRTGTPLLPRQDDPQSVIRSALAIVQRLRCPSGPESFTQTLPTFLQDSRLHPDYTYTYTPNETYEAELFNETATDWQILNALPLGRQYVKKSLSDGTLQWRLTKALNHQPILHVTVKHSAKAQEAIDSSPFETETLGQWRLIPEPYRVYWSYRATYLELKSSTNPNTLGLKVCDGIRSYLETRKMPDHVRRALERLWFDTALLTNDFHRLCQSLRATVAGFCQDEAVSTSQALMEFGRIAEKVESYYPKRSETVLKPLVKLMVKHAGEGIIESFRKHIRSINSNKWSIYGDMLLEAMRCQLSVEATTINTLDANYQAARLVQKKEPFDRSKSITTVKRYLTLLDGSPPHGSLTIDDVRHVLEEGLTGQEPADASNITYVQVANIIKSIRLIAGEGPFRGNQAELIKSIERFSRTYFAIFRKDEAFGTTLATFLALSFYDISTPQDHDALCGKICQLSHRLQSQVNTMLAAHAIHSLVTPEDVKNIFSHYYGEKFRWHVDDPLCPAFKFPLTENEEIRLTNRLVLQFYRLEPLFEDISLKVKYGGMSEEIKRATVSGISQAAYNLLPSIAFLRRPPFTGVICQYRGRHGIATKIPATLYQAGHRPKERFQAMQYFHLGHRLDDVVKRELALMQQKY